MCARCTHYLFDVHFVSLFCAMLCSHSVAHNRYRTTIFYSSFLPSKQLFNAYIFKTCNQKNGTLFLLSLLILKYITNESSWEFQLGIKCRTNTHNNLESLEMTNNTEMNFTWKKNGQSSQPQYFTIKSVAANKWQTNVWKIGLLNL